MRIPIFLAITMVAASLNGVAQKSKAPERPHGLTKDSLAAHNQRVYEEALINADLVVATMAAYNMLALDPSRSSWNDSLAVLYFSRGMAAQAVAIGRDVLEESPEKTRILEIVAVCEDELGLAVEALERYGELFRLTQDIFYMYQVASLQFRLKRFGECGAVIDAVVDHPEAASSAVSISDGQKSQQVPLPAAALNLKGAMFVQLNQPDLALESFEAAVASFPEFELAKKNVEAMKKAQTEKGSGSK